jgi:hypothetical protein
MQTLWVDRNERARTLGCSITVLVVRPGFKPVMVSLRVARSCYLDLNCRAYVQILRIQESLQQIVVAVADGLATHITESELGNAVDHGLATFALKHGPADSIS